MKKRAIFYTFIGLLLYVSSTMAQTYYYDTTKTFYETGYTYQCDVPEYGLVTLYNKSNTYTYVKQIYKDGSPLGQEFYDGYVNLLELGNDTWTKPKCHSIVNNAFSSAEIFRLKGNELGITLIIDSNTGKVIEVNFDFHKINKFATIPISVYRKIETELKANIWFTTTETGKKLNYLMLFWRQEVKLEITQ
jgi:hypothetical protein